uniref:Chemokine interleukin-8-like domain-containing protein n=1 Tax=Anguilla anguilla TaxID=7936 RepID=A0A0E9V260_ANGAN
MELVATLKGSGELKCLNPKSRFARNFIKNAQRQKRSPANGEPVEECIVKQKKAAFPNRTVSYL